MRNCHQKNTDSPTLTRLSKLQRSSSHPTNSNQRPATLRATSPPAIKVQRFDACPPLMDPTSTKPDKPKTTRDLDWSSQRIGSSRIITAETKSGAVWNSNQGSKMVLLAINFLNVRFPGSFWDMGVCYARGVFFRVRTVKKHTVSVVKIGRTETIYTNCF